MKSTAHPTIASVLRAMESTANANLPGTDIDRILHGEAADPLLLELANAAPDAAPPDDLFDRIEAELDPEPIQGVETIVASEDGWEDHGQGTWVKLMASSPDGKNVFLLRCVPGAVIQAHTHSGWEYALVIEGRFQIEGRTVRAGDSQVSAANSFHPEITTDIGCLILVVA